jgi:hypothetical protein
MQGLCDSRSALIRHVMGGLSCIHPAETEENLEAWVTCTLGCEFVFRVATPLAVSSNVILLVSFGYVGNKFAYGRSHAGSQSIKASQFM